VTPYRCEQDSINGALWRIFVYDNNYPMDNAVHFLIDTLANRWEYSPLGWAGRDELFLADSIGRYCGDATLKTTAMSSQSSDAVDNRITAFIRNAGMITFESSLGAVGRSGDSVFCDVDGARPILPLLAGESDSPMGFYLPRSDWRCDISDAESSVVGISFVTDSLILDYRRSGVNGTDSDRLLYSSTDSNLWVFGADTPRSYIVRAIMIGVTEERVVSISGLVGSANDSCLFGPGSQSEFTLGNFGEESSYNIELEVVGTIGRGRFASDDILLPSNTTHQLVPDWENLQEEQLKIMIDSGNDGSIDDSLLVANIITDVKDDDYGGALPYSFELSQNYPNPFNPVTTIEYSLPERSNVTIEIYNVLGQRVQTLVNREESAGSYTVTWDGSDASGKPAATGLYLYRFQAGDHVETKKMLLLK